MPSACYTEVWLKNNHWSVLALAERKRKYELIMALSPVSTEAEATVIVTVLPMLLPRRVERLQVGKNGV